MKELIILTTIIFVSRFLPGLDNFTPILAFALLAPMLTNNKYLQYGLPLSIMLLSDPLLGGFSNATPFVYSAIAFATLIGNLFKNETNHVFKVLFVGASWHCFMLPTIFMHGDSTYFGQVHADLLILTSTGITYFTFMFVSNMINIFKEITNGEELF